MENTTVAQKKTHEFVFDINKIDLPDLKKLYKHFEIEDFGDANSATDKVFFLIVLLKMNLTVTEMLFY